MDFDPEARSKRPDVRRSSSISLRLFEAETAMATFTKYECRVSTTPKC
jgi:hypothetical protein